jgi:hypothetical protein
MNPEKIKVVENYPIPNKAKDLQKFLGLANYFRKFIPKYSELCAPLYVLIRKDSKWNWTEEHLRIFNILKEKLISYTILRQPDIKKPFILATDASGIAVGAILSQKNENGYEYVVSYASKTLKGAELHYGVTEKECLAVVWAISEFRVNLYGS